MEFYKHILDPRRHRKIKGLFLATVLLVLGYIDSTTWTMAFMIFVGGNAYDKFLEKKK